MASPQEVGDTQWAYLLGLLDDDERERALQFRQTADHHSYVLAHALQRMVLGEALAIAPGAVAFSNPADGKPTLAGPRRPDLFFSLSRSRRGVVFALTTVGPVGVDIEPVSQDLPDFELLSRFLALPAPPQREAELGPDPVLQFLFYWTALEAFWKAEGGGLASANPRIAVCKNDSGGFEVAREGAPPQARLVPMAVMRGCMIALALSYPQAQELPARFAAIQVKNGNQLINRNT